MSVVTEPIMLDTTGQALVTALSQITAMQGPAGEDGVSPTVTVETIPGGHRITITDASGAHSFDVMDGDGATEVLLVPMTLYSDGTVDFSSAVGMQDIHDAKEAGKLVIGRTPTLTLLFESEWNYGGTNWEIYFGAVSPNGLCAATFSQNRPDGHDGEWEITPLLSEAPSDNKQYARRNGAWSEVQAAAGSSEHIYNVKDYGAKGNWVTDDYDAIMAAIADAEDHPALGVGGGTHATVYFPAGTYYISQGIELDEYATPISIIGESSASVTITGDMSGALLTLYRSDSALSYDSTVSGLTLRCTGSATGGLLIEQQNRCVVEDVVIYNIDSTPEGYGLVVDNSSQVFCSHIRERGFYVGCYIDSPPGMEDIYFSDCRFDGNVGNGFEAHDVHGLYLTNVTMHGNQRAGLYIGAPFISEPPYCTAENLFLNNVVADTSGGMNCAIYWADNVTMTNCLFAKQLYSPTSADTHGLYIDRSKNITISASTFRDNYDSGIYAVYSTGLSIGGCVFRKNGQRSAYTYAIDLALCNDITVTNNLFVPEGEQERGIIIDGCDYYIVTGNILEGATTGVYATNDPSGVQKVVENNLE